MQRKFAEKKSEILSEAIMRTLRKGDVYTRYSVGQFLIILNQAEEKHCIPIFQRIADTYESLGGSRRELVYQITSVSEKNR